MGSNSRLLRLTTANWSGKRLVHSVEHVRYSFLKCFPAVLVISADGWVHPEGSSDPELRALPADARSREDLLELAFLCCLPRPADDGSLQPIHADLEWRDSPEAVRRITVHSETNHITTKVGQA